MGPRRRTQNPRGWLIRVASRRLIDLTRSNLARSAREAAVAVAQPGDAYLRRESISMKPVRPTTVCCCFCCAAIGTDPPLAGRADPARGLGLTAAQIAAAFLVPEPTMAQRPSRARAPFRQPPHISRHRTRQGLPERVAAVLDVLHLVFNEGYTGPGTPWSTPR